MRRRDFIKQASSALLILSSGNILSLTDGYDVKGGGKTVLRFAVASDGHYGQKDTEYEKYIRELVENINRNHEMKAFDFCVINGDIIHDDKTFFPDAKKALDKLAVKYYVSQGNHDRVTADEWEEIWKMPVNLDFSIRKNAVLVGTTSNEKGTYLCPDLKWFAQKLEEYKEKKNIFIFIHINPGKQTANAVDCPEFFDLLSKYKNVKAVFNGHDHDVDNIMMKNEVPFIFDAHFGGNWGTAYRGFRIVELHKDNSLLTYILNPADKLNEQTLT
jgi:thiol-disulfide isomerase/thioredoxin